MKNGIVLTKGAILQLFIIPETYISTRLNLNLPATEIDMPYLQQIFPHRGIIMPMGDQAYGTCFNIFQSYYVQVPPPFTKQASIHSPKTFNPQSTFPLGLAYFLPLYEMVFLSPTKRTFFYSYPFWQWLSLGSKNINMWYMDELVRLALISIILSAIDKEFPCHISNFFSDFSSILA
jgi:hypothetical protein